MTTVFCCRAVQPYRPRPLTHDEKFRSFMKWAEFPQSTSLDPTTNEGQRCLSNPSFVVQLVRQVNFGPLESKRYFAKKEGYHDEFFEVCEHDLIQANFQKLNTYVRCIRISCRRLTIRTRYKNWKCDKHNKFFETNIYQKDPVNQHHWRANVARPAGDIDL